MATSWHYPWARRGSLECVVVLHLLWHLPGSKSLHTQACAQSSRVSGASGDAGPPVQDPVPLTHPVKLCNERRALELGRSRSESQLWHDLSLNKRHTLRGPRCPHLKNSNTTFTGCDEDQQRCWTWSTELRAWPWGLACGKHVVIWWVMISKWSPRPLGIHEIVFSINLPMAVSYDPQKLFCLGSCLSQ